MSTATAEQQEKTAIFYTNSRGYKVPEDQMTAQDILKHELVVDKIAKAKALSQMHDDFKREVFSDVQDFISLIADEYNVKIGGIKGNITLTSFDGKSKIAVGIDDQISFGPEIDIAKQLITQVIEDELADTSSFISDLMRDAFEADKQGQYNKNRILALRKYRNANDSDDWASAMKALDDAIIAGSSKTYIRFFETNEFGKWIQIPMVSTSL